jgi:GDP/UDP-N,N'-diacetylbacillosamine 2-epimerase (hydrolysing)
MSIKKIVAFTGIRSDYDLLSGLYKKIDKEPGLDIKLVVSGSHLASSYGYSVQEIINDEIPILTRIESLIDSDKPSARLKSLSIVLQAVIPAIEDYNPDLLIVVGDREDVIVGSLVGSYLGIPIAHFFGGDHALDGNVDNPIRHATSKLAHLHFVSNKFSKARLKSMGEEDKRIFNIGSPSLDKFNNTKRIEKKELLKTFNLSGIEKYAVLIFHPTIEEEQKSGEYFQQILDVLQKKKIFTFVSYPNVDSGNKLITDIIHANKDNVNFYFYKNLNRELFINLLRNTDFLIGNSSAGIYEAPFLKKPVVNVGIRQLGRYSTDNVIFVDQDSSQINDAIESAQSEKFLYEVKHVKSIYGDGDSEQKALQILKSIEYSDYLAKTADPLEVNNE